MDGVGLGPLEIVNMKNKIALLRQKPGTSIEEFKKEFDLQYETLRGAGVPVTAQPELAMLFLSKLDPHRSCCSLASWIHADMLQCLRNLPMMQPLAEHFRRR